MTEKIDDNLIFSLWKKISKTRAVEEKIVEIYPEKDIRCPVHLSLGQEGVAAGVSQALNKEDLVFSNHRSHAHYISKGGDIKSMFAELYGKKTGCAGGRGGSMHLLDESVGFMGATPIVGNTIPLAVGAALSVKMQNKKQVVVLYIGDGAIEEGVFHESINFASLKKLPILFVCENNLYSVYTPLAERQPIRPIYTLAIGHGVEASQGDGTDAHEVYKVAQEAVEKIRNGGGPIFLEFLTYRWRTHCGIDDDDHLKYRDEAELKKWKGKDPLVAIKNKITNSTTISNRDLDNETNRINKEINEAVEFAKKSPYPSLDEPLKVYS